MSANALIQGKRTEYDTPSLLKKSSQNFPSEDEVPNLPQKEETPEMKGCFIVLPCFKPHSAKPRLVWKWLQFSDFTFSSPWKIPWTEEPGRLQSMGLRRVRHDWATSLSLFTFMHLRRKWKPTPVFLAWRIPGMEEPGELPSMGSHRVGHNWSDLAAAAAPF